MSRIQNILVGVDLHHGDRLASPEISDEAKAAVDEALRLAATWSGNVTFCSILDISAQTQTLIESDQQNVFKTVEDVAANVLSELVKTANEQGIAAESVVRFGTAWEELSKESAKGDYDLVMIGTRSRSRASRFLFGSTAQKLLRYSPRPVWVVKPGLPLEIRTVAAASDFSPTSQLVVDEAVTVARALGARLYLLHAVDLSDFRYLKIAGLSDEQMSEAEERLKLTSEDKLQDQLHRTDYRTLAYGVKIELLNGIPDTVIPEFVAANEIDLLVMGTRGHSDIADMLLGSTVERILPGLHASLLGVKPADFKSPYSK